MWDGGVPDPDFVEIKRMNRRSEDQEFFSDKPPGLLTSCLNVLS
jgi:hypothetical protein